jgi:cell wall-associated NlpC family hydrolase
MNIHPEETPRRRRTRQEVRQLDSAFQTSGLRAREFCQRHGLAPSTLRRNLKGAGAASAPAQPAVRFVALNVNGAAPAAKAAPAAVGLEVVLAGGRRIGVGPGFDERTLGRLVRALEGL